MQTEGIPVIRRARGFRLYGGEGRRYLDLFRDGGGALLGHRSGATVSEMKSALSQGLAASLPSVWEARLLRAVAAMFPDHTTVRLFSSRARALEAAALCAGARAEPSDVYDPALGASPPGHPRVALWRPFLSDLDAKEWPVILPVLPLTVCGAPAPACFSGNPPLPDSDHLPGFVLAGALSGLAELRRAGGFPAVSPVLLRAIDSSKGWARAGPYVRATFHAESFPGVFKAFLGAGVLLAPEYPGPSILPGSCSPGEARLLAELFSSIPGG